MNPFFSTRFEPLVTVSGQPVKQLAVINEEKNKVIGIVSPKYKLVTNEEVATVFEEALPYDVESVKDHFFDYGAIWKRRIVLDRNAFDFEVVPGDSTGILIEIFNSYNGKVSYGFSMMGFRWICSNGQIMGKKMLLNMSFTHMQNAIEKIRSTFKLQLDSFHDTMNIWKKWNGEKFTMIDMQKYLDTRSYLTNKGRDRILDTYQTVMNNEGHDETRYGAYNALTYAATHNLKNSAKREAAGSSEIFSNSALTLTRITEDFYDYVPLAA